MVFDFFLYYTSAAQQVGLPFCWAFWIQLEDQPLSLKRVAIVYFFNMKLSRVWAAVFEPQKHPTWMLSHVYDDCAAGNIGFQVQLDGSKNVALSLVNHHSRFVWLICSWGEVITIRDICFSSPTVSPFESALLPVDCSFFEIVQITLVYFSTCIISWSLNTYIQWVHHFLFHFSDLVNENCELLFS